MSDLARRPGSMPHDALTTRAAVGIAGLTVVVALIVGCSAPDAGAVDVTDDPSAALHSAPAAADPAASPTGESPSPIPSLSASLLPAGTPVVSATATATTPTDMPSAPAGTRIRTFPVEPNGSCDGMTVDDPLRLTLDLSQPERDGAMLTDRTDWNVYIVWPDGFTVVGDADERVLLDDRGHIVGRQGDDVTIPATVIFPSGGFDEPIVAEGILFGRCYRRAVEFPKASVVRTTDEGLRMRTAPGTSPGSPLGHAGLPSGAALYVLDGPVSDDGHDWYRVEWLDAPLAIPIGWVAGADLDGRRFVEADTLDCPPAPSVPSDVARMAHGYRVSCFGADPLTIRARLVPCECSVDGPYEGLEPSWLMPDYGPDGPWILIDPTAAGPSPILSEDLFLIRHPDSPSPDSLGDAIVLVTGMFGHPDAADCATWVGDGPANPGDCSGTFVVTGIEPV